MAEKAGKRGGVFDGTERSCRAKSIASLASCATSSAGLGPAVKPPHVVEAVRTQLTCRSAVVTAGRPSAIRVCQYVHVVDRLILLAGHFAT